VIYLNPEVRSGLGEDTFWTWFHREFPKSTFAAAPKVLAPDDCLLQYSTMGPPSSVGITIGLMWELYHEMRDQLKSSEWNKKIAKVEACAKSCKHLVVASELMSPCYEPFGKVDVIPIGVDTELFRPPQDKAALRESLGMPDEYTVFWCGTKHLMKGYDSLSKMMVLKPDWNFVVQWKHQSISQTALARIMQACDAVAVVGLLRPYFMVEWEAMACDLAVLKSTDMVKDFEPSESPRQDVFSRGWSRKDARTTWAHYLTSKGVDV